MEPIITAIKSALAYEVTAKTISYAISIYSEMKNEDKRLDELRGLLERVTIIIDEAEGQLITNPAMVQKLSLMIKEMYRGCFTMDSLRSQGQTAEGHNVSQSSAESKLNPCKRPRFFPVEAMHRNKELQQVIDNLNDIISDAKEFIIFLNNYPPRYRQPYNMHLFIGKCMFGRQMEVYRIMNFLMQRGHPSMGSVGVLPIVGPGYVGKSTLVAHVCDDKEVRKHFCQIVRINGDYIKEDALANIEDGSLISYQSNALVENEKLVIVEFSENVDEVSWNRFYLSSLRCLAAGSKIIITSTSDKITKFGTTPALKLNFLPPEAYWYFFKTLTFGSADPRDYPKLVSIAMEMAREMSGSFIVANIISGILRSNISTQNWSSNLAALKAAIQRNVSVFGEHPYNLLRNKKQACYGINKDEYVVSDQYHACLAPDNVPEVKMHDILSGNINCQGTFEVLAWKSPVLPCKSYTISCRRLLSI